MLELEQNAARSEAIKERDEKIIQDKARSAILEDEKKQLEELARTRENTRYKYIAREAQKKFNEHLRGGNGGRIRDEITHLVVLGKEIDDRVAEAEKLHKDALPYIDRFNTHPDQFKLFNENVVQRRGGNPFSSVDDLQNKITERKHLQWIKDFFERYDEHTENTNETGDE